jgi:hypothetical protein
MATMPIATHDASGGIKVSKKSSFLWGWGLALGLMGCVTQGTHGTAVSGSAAGGTSADADVNLERCSETLGTLAIDDGRESAWWTAFGYRTNVTTIEPMIRLAVQQSNCFVITSIGNLRTDSRLSRITDKQRTSGEYRPGSKQQKGQRVAADYYMEPSIIIDDSPLGRAGGIVGGLLGGTAGAVAGGFSASSSVVTLTLFDIRSSVQLAASEGSATSTNYGAALAGLGAEARSGDCRIRPRARRRLPRSSMPTTAWCGRSAITRRRTSKAASAPGASSRSTEAGRSASRAS